ncbi:MAG TPA: transposase [Desulfuromonadales bacterium]|nr:transposase [Desulfuromonadales bacterium]
MTLQHHGKNLRRGRVSITGQVYAITSVTHNRTSFFKDIFLARIVINAMRFHHDHGNVESFAFVVMPDHFHWMFCLSDKIDLAGLMQSVKGFSAREIKRKIGGDVEAVWQEGYFDHALRTDENVKIFARYLIMNPVRAGLVKNIWMYPLWDAMWVDGEDGL